MKRFDLSKRSLAKFGRTVGIVLILIAVILFIRHRGDTAPEAEAIIFALGAEFIAVSILLPWILKPFYLVWMSLVRLLGWINARILLFLAYYLVLTPLALILKMLGRDPLEKDIKRPSYWHKKEKKDFQKRDYERQF